MKTTEDGSVKIQSLYDIKKVINDLNSQNDGQVEVQTEMQVVNQDGSTVKTNLSAPSSCDYKFMLKEGFETLRKRSEMAENTKTNDGLKVFNIEGRMWLDNLIERRMGGRRDGLKVVWQLEGSTYQWDPFTNKLFEVDQ